MFRINDIRGGAGLAARSGGQTRPGDGTCPRDIQIRFERFGCQGLTDLELLGMVLGGGGPVSGSDTAADLLTRFGSLPELGRVHPEALLKIRGMGIRRVKRMLAALELGRRSGGVPDRAGLAVRRPEDLHDLLRDEFMGLDRERFVALYLDTRHRVLTLETVSIGSLNASLVHPREVFKPAVAISAAAVIVAHNHPSGCAVPSAEDLELTGRLDRSGQLLGIALLDHLVAGSDEILSIREYGWPEALPS